VINEAAARRYFGSKSPLGKRVGYGPLTTEVVGVVGDARVNTLREAPVPMAFYSIEQSSERQFATAMELRVTGNAVAVGETARRAISTVEPRLLADARPVTVASQLEQGLARDRLMAYLADAFGLLALLLACVGLYGVLTYAVASRTSEIGVRMAIGASPTDVLRLVVGEGLRVALLGVVGGTAAAFAASRTIQTLLFGVTSSDSLTYVEVIEMLMTVAAMASLIPARRAARVDPTTALRAE